MIFCSWSYHPRNGLLIIKIPIEGFSRQVAFGSLFHLFTGAVNLLLRQVSLVPIIFVPTDEEPNMTGPVQSLLVHFTQDPACCHHIKKTDDNSGILGKKIYE